MIEVPCFLITPLPLARRTFRRFTNSNVKRCPVSGYTHEASEVVEEVWAPPGGGPPTRRADAEALREPRWPTHCRYCGYAFTDDDIFQDRYDHLYERKGTEERYTLLKAPVGAMWYAPWYEETPAIIPNSPDGKAIVVQTHRFEWLIDGASTNGNGWRRTGVPPRLTVTPSWRHEDYEVVLVDGVLRVVAGRV